MSTRSLVLLVLLLPFLALSAYVIETAGLVGFYQEMSRSASTVLAGVDLSLSLGLILFWMHGDARANGLPFAPYVAVTLAIGVAGPLMYLIHRELRAPRARVATARG
ncbi:MAG TPA: hypothetical protein VFT98_06280 [Myxococcota bacterium]|nr:hypothetical protein [Myxococcota bacterium]